ncbi:MAG: hypothetical protein AAF433_11830 [Bacteroidota bacterium]
MKHRFLFFLALCATTLLQATNRPLEIIVNFPGPYPMEIAAYFNNPASYTITVINHTDQDQELYFLAEMRGLDNGVLVQTLDSYRPMDSYLIPAEGVVMLTGEDIANLNEGIEINDLQINGLPATELNVNGILPEGMYQFCINAYDFNLDQLQPLSVGCGTFFDIVYGDQLLIMEPFDGDVIPENPQSTFTMRWDPNILDPMLRMGLEYEVKLMDLTLHPDEDLDLLLRDGGPQVFWELDMIMDEWYNYNATGADFELEFGHQYAMRVRAIDPSESIPWVNDGYSQVTTFWYGEQPEEITGGSQPPVNPPPPPPSDCAQACNYVAAIDNTPAADPASFSSLLVGHFMMEDVVFTQPAAGNGNGTIRIPWLANLPMAVTFSGLQVNTEGRVFGGTVKLRDDSQTTYDLTDINDRLGVANDYVPENVMNEINSHVTSLRMLEMLIGGQPTGAPIGIQETIQGRSINLAIIDATFEADGASFNLISLLDFSSISPHFKVALGAKDVCLTPAGIGAEATLLQLQDVDRPGLAGVDFVLKGSDQVDNNGDPLGSFVTMDCDGLSRLVIKGEAIFPRTAVVPDVDGEIAAQGRVKGYFEMDLDRNVDPTQSAYAYQGPDNLGLEGNHLMLSYTMDPFQINGLDGWTFTLTQGSLDLSDVENPATLVFPEEYETAPGVEIDDTWQGFHLKQLTLQPPSRMAREGAPRASVAISDILIEPNADISMQVLANNLINLNDGRVEGWGFSLDTFQLSLVQNTLIEGRLLGKINTPVMAEEDHFVYRATLDRNANEKFRFYAVAQPSAPIGVPLAAATAGLCPNSFVSFNLTPDSTAIGAFLAGQLSVDVTNNLPNDFQQLDLLPELSIRLADFQFNYNSIDGFVTEEDVSDGTHSSFGFGLDLQTEFCGNAYVETFFEPEGFEGYQYSQSDIDSLMQNGYDPNASQGQGSSPQEEISGFPITIEGYNFGFEGSEVSLDFTLGLHLAGEGNREIHGTTTIELLAQLELDGIKPKRIALDRIRLLGVTVGTEEAPIDLDVFWLYGGIEFVESNGGRGFQGEMAFGMSDFVVDLRAGFGKSGTPDTGAFGTEDYFGWWYFDGNISFPAPIMISPTPLGIAGFGGGVFWNVNTDHLSVSLDDVMAMNEEGNTAGLPEFDPDPEWDNKAVRVGLSMSIVEPNVVLLEPEFAVTWTSAGLGTININGDFYVLGGRDAARIYGQSINTIAFEEHPTDSNRKLVAASGVNTIYANIIDGILYGAGPDNALVSSTFAFGHESLLPEDEYGIDHGDADNNFWFFNAGNPYNNNMGGIVFDLPGFNMDEADEGDGGSIGADVGVSAQFYTMVGQNIPGYLPDPPPAVDALFGQVFGGSSGDGEGSFEGGEREDEREDERATTGHGLVLGAHVAASAEFNMVVYARLALMTGMDILITQLDEDERSCVTSDGRVIDEIGVNGWYGLGRAYAGIEGTIGAKGKILGKEIDVKIMELVAAVMLEAGGPRPMWLDGRAGVSYSLLGGLIEGSARIQIEVGDRCVPPTTSPFDFPVIVESFPDETMNGRGEISPFVQPSVAFSIPVSLSATNPEPDRILEVTDRDGNTFRRYAYLEEFSITPLATDQSILEDWTRDPNTDLLRDGGRKAEYNPVTAISGRFSDDRNRRWRMRVVIKAKEWVNVNGQWRWRNFRYQNQDWEEVLDFEFSTYPLPDQFDDSQVGLTQPFRNQRFYMQNEVENDFGQVLGRTGLFDAYFESEDVEGNALEYEAIFKRASDYQEIARMPITYIQADKKVRFNMPELANSTDYLVQIIRKGSGEATPAGASLMRVIGGATLLNDQERDLNSSYQVIAPTPELDRSTQVRFGEILHYTFNFRTSQYDRMQDRMAHAEISAYEEDGYQHLEIHGDFEGFDAYDVFGKDDSDSRFRMKPRVQIRDPFNSNFHETISKPDLGSFVQGYIAEYQGVDNGVRMNADLPTGDLGFNSGPAMPGNANPNNNGFPGQGQEPGFGNNNFGGGRDFETEEVTLEYDFSYLPYANFQWNNPNSIYLVLNDYVDEWSLTEADGSISDRRYFEVGQFGGVTLRYYVTERVIEDAENFLDFVEEEIEETRRPSRGYQSLSSYQLNNLLANLEQMQSELASSLLINLPIDWGELTFADGRDTHSLFSGQQNNDDDDDQFVIADGGPSLVSGGNDDDDDDDNPGFVVAGAGPSVVGGGNNSGSFTAGGGSGLGTIGFPTAFVAPRSAVVNTISSPTITTNTTATAEFTDDPEITVQLGSQYSEYGFSNSLLFIGNKAYRASIHLGGSLKTVNFEN